jgi:drug/metabolite transporter (DMT)-like permease
MARGVVFALFAAASFGITTPAVKVFSAHAGAFATAALLYAGAALASVGRADRSREAPVRRAHARRIVAVAIVGGVVAPVLLAHGLRSTGGATASLLLNFEALFTALVGWRLYREHLGRRFALAIVLMLAGGACLVVAREGRQASAGWGAAAIVGAAMAWAADNAFTRALADLDVVQVTRLKGVIAATSSAAVAIVSGSRFPPLGDAIGLVACGVVGYGVSLRLYLGAQRRIGAGRTGAIFSAGPFVGAIAAWIMGDRSGGMLLSLSALLFAGGVVLQATEAHAHGHRHDALDHEHPHRHDDGHHDHAHDPPFEGEHSHPHRHEPVTHEHPHAADLHHQHH